jgi:oxygen-independent coproporphyrinogen-3 oxidase
MKYWLGIDYLGFGPGAHSLWDGVRYSYPKDVFGYISECKSGTPQKIFEEKEEEYAHSTPQIDKMDEYVMLHLRLKDGVDEDEFEALFNSPFISEYPRIKDFVASGHMVRERGRCFFTPQGFFVSNYVYTEILHF